VFRCSIHIPFCIHQPVANPWPNFMCHRFSNDSSHQNPEPNLMILVGNSTKNSGEMFVDTTGLS
jgi:hypothetical protein